MQPGQQQLRAKVLGMLETPSSQQGNQAIPKEDKILEWTLFKIYEELKQLNENVMHIRVNMKS
jgi:hypothetical protein